MDSIIAPGPQPARLRGDGDEGTPALTLAAGGA